VPEILTSAAHGKISRPAKIGFHGKIPARGDFVQSGLPRSFVDPWDGWMRRMIAASRAALGQGWVPAWLDTPVWRFALSSGLCGPDAVIGLWMPSVDSVGRYFPLTIAVVTAPSDSGGLISEAAGFLVAAECAGRVALTNGLDPREIGSLLASAAVVPSSSARAAACSCPADGALWCTEGGPRVSARVFASEGLPDGNTFAVMLDACAPISPAVHFQRAR